MWAAASSVGLALCSAASLVIVLASCGKDDPVPRDISMPIDDFPPSAELYLHDVQGTPVARGPRQGSCRLSRHFNEPIPSFRVRGAFG